MVFHVQTEDSGVNNPHLFTHLFHGGVIISTRKLEYDAEAHEDVVKALMQAQHKAVLKDLKRGEFDEKMDTYLAGHPDLMPRGPEASRVAVKEAEAYKGTESPAAPIPISTTEVSEAFQAIVEQQQVSSRVTQPIRGTGAGQVRAPSPIAPAPPPVIRDPSAGETTPPAPKDELAGAPLGGGSDPGIRRTPLKPPPPPVSKSRGATGPADSAPVPPQPPPPPRGPRQGGNVLVSRPPIVVDSSRRGGPRPPSSPGPRPARAPARIVREDPQDSSIFDQNLISEKSLDEVILAYLSEDSGED